MALHHQSFDTIIIGAGQAGPGLASALDGRGEKVALFEQRAFGGTCLNDGCRPTKAMRASARVAHLARTAAKHGVHTGDVTVDLAETVARKDELIDAWREGGSDYYENHETISYVVSTARLTGRDGDLFTVEHDGGAVTAKRIIVNSGARSVPPPVPGLDGIDWLDHHRILELTETPDHLVVLGGSYIGLEFGQMFARFGSKVTIVEMADRIIGREDPDISEAIGSMLRREGLDVREGVGVSRIDVTESGARLHLNGGDNLDASHVLVAAGRIPNSDDLGLETVGVETDERGYISTDEHFATNVDGVYAVGDVNGRGAFTHTSYQDGTILADHLAGGDMTVAGRIPTYGLFTDPPLGRVGMTLTQAQDAGLNVEVAITPGDGVTKAALDGETEGLWKLVVDKDKDRVVGASFFGLYGDEAVQAVSVLMHVDAPASALATWLPIHPTSAEFLPTFYAGLAKPE
ncbi:mercuric reductase [Demequina oxidasica]|uniref:mercuric reductase n=1 Tax=Demequina oxidasica TaxID=676199 RepID=UPI0007831BA8|nr:mercuric reductase [Demequina oxidasica]